MRTSLRLVVWTAIAGWPLLGGAALASVGLAQSEDFGPAPILTPPPEEVAGVKTPVAALGGTWRFAAAPSWAFSAQDFDDRSWKPIEVPGEWAMQGFTVAKGTAAGYRRQFAVPADWAGQQIKLRFDAVYSDATVWINGREAGRHMGGFTPFELDVTALAHPGQPNTIALAVKQESLTNDKFTTFGSRYAWHPLGGISRKVRLFAVPPVNIDSLHVATQFDHAYRDATLRVQMDVANQSAQTVTGAAVQLELSGPGAAASPVVLGAVALPTLAPHKRIAKVAEFPVAAPTKWDAEHPNMYVLTGRVVVGPKRLETVDRRIGFRQVEIRGNQLFVNGRPVKLRGVCRHEAYATRGKSLTPALSRKLAQLFRDANINLVRTSHYPPTEEFLDACDELGLFVEEEAPFHHAQPIVAPDYRQATVRHTAEMLEHDRSHPAVIIWSVGNEADWSPNFEASAGLIRKVDPTRPRLFSGDYFRKYKGFACGEMEIASWHYPGPGGPAAAANYHKPVIFDEYCHLNTYNREEIVTDPGLRDAWGRGFAAMWGKMYVSRGCLGGTLWAGIDEIFFLPSGNEVGLGAWGILDSWYRCKPEYWHVKKVYAPLRVLTTTIAVPSPGEPIRLEVANRHDFTNLGELAVKWTIGDESGTATADVPPRSTGILSIRPKSVPRSGQKLTLRFLSPRGFLIDSCEVVIGKPAAPADNRTVRANPGATGAPQWIQTGDAITVNAGHVAWSVDRRSGLIRQARSAGRNVLVGGPVLMVLPLRTSSSGPNSAPHHAGVPAFTPCCADWQATTVRASRGDQGVTIQVEGKYREATGTYALHVDGAGRMSVDYRFVYGSAVDPRQVGVVFDLPGSCNTLAWRRDAQWTDYPADHIGRPVGQAKAFRDDSWPKGAYGQLPPWPWALDSTELGTNDFRATRLNIRHVSLRDDDGFGVQINSDGTQHARAYVEGNRIHLLIAKFCTAGAEHFFAYHLKAERQPLHKGSVIEDTVKLEILGPRTGGED
jgi:hypothetical protein